MMNDLRYALRMLTKSPGFTAVAVITLALGIGACTAIFSFVDAVLLKPLPYEQPGQLVQIWAAPAPGRQSAVSPGAFLDWKSQATVFESLSLRQDAEMNLTGSGEPERISGLGMSASGLQILRAHPIIGRTFAADEDQPGKDKVVVLTQELWQRRFNGQANIVGQAIRLDDQSYTVIGVLPRQFLPWEKAEFVVPAAIAPRDANERGADWLQVIARLKQGVDVQQANAAMKALSEQLGPLYPPEKKNWGIAVAPLHEGGAPTTSFTIVGREGQPEEGIDTDFDFCTPDYFRAVGTPLRAGRFFDQHDAPGQTRALLINEAFAQQHFPNEDPIGKRLHLDAFTRKVDGGWEIVGIVGDVHQRGLNVPPKPCVYRPQAFGFSRDSVNLVVRTASAPLGLAKSVQDAIHEVDPNQPVANVQTMADVMAASFAQRRFTLIVIGGFAISALLLVAIGLYGVLAYAVSERVREIGIRMALGAQRREVLGLVLSEGMKLAGIGVAIGLAGSFAFTRFLGNLLFAIKPTDPLTLAGVSSFLLAVSLLACYIPAHRASRVDPMTALRAE